MKTHEYARNLELLAKWLRRLPNVELEDSLSEVTQSLLPGMAAPGKRESLRLSRPYSRGIEKELAVMPIEEIEKFLSSKDSDFTVANLNEIARRLGIATSSRQNKSALINQIVRHFEADQMHAMMRGAKNQDK